MSEEEKTKAVSEVEEKVKVKEEEIEPSKEEKSPSQWVMVWYRLRKNQFAMVSLGYFLMNVLIAIFYPIFIPYNPTSTPALKDRLSGSTSDSPPNLRYPLGTYPPGRDTFSAVMAGSETSLVVGFVATIFALSIGVSIGLAAGFYGGIVEELAMRTTDIFLSLPFLIIAITMVNVMLNSKNPKIQQMPTIWIIIIALGVFGWAGTARLVTATVKQTTDLDYVKAARVLGASNLRLMVIHILPNVLAPIIVVATLSIGGNILAEAGITFLGIGDPNRTVSWGQIVNVAQRELRKNPYVMFISGFAIFFLVLAINILGDALRDALDPRLKE